MLMPKLDWLGDGKTQQLGSITIIIIRYQNEINLDDVGYFRARRLGE